MHTFSKSAKITVGAFGKCNCDLFFRYIPHQTERNLKYRFNINNTTKYINRLDTLSFLNRYVQAFA
jgi:hypothetical protein